MIIFNDIIGKKLINARDIGGLKTADGKKIVKGRLIRSGRIADIPESTVKIIKKLGVKTIIDLRTGTECSDHPGKDIDGIERLKLPTVTTVTDVINDERTMRLTMKRESKRLNVEFGSAKEYMAEMYRSVVFNDEPKQSLKSFFKAVAQADDPVIWHCTSGKDRTGICAMLLESVLGVEEKDIYSDYLYSNARLFRRNVFLTFVLMISPFKMRFKKLLISYLGVKKEYLQGIIEELKEKYGSVTAYCKKELGVTDEDVFILKSKYLVEA